MIGLVDIGLSHNKNFMRTPQRTSQQKTHKKSPCLDPNFTFITKANEFNSNM